MQVPVRQFILKSDVKSCNETALQLRTFDADALRNYLIDSFDTGGTALVSKSMRILMTAMNVWYISVRSFARVCRDPPAIGPLD